MKPAHHNRPSPDRAPIRLRETGAAYKPRTKLPGEAQARSYSTLQEVGIYDGAELRPFAGRSGSMDAFALPSLGVRT